MRLLLPILLAAYAFSLPTPSFSAAFQSSNNLLKKCDASDYINKSECLGYIEGVSDTLESPEERFSVVDGKTFPLPRICPRSGITTGQIVDIAVQYLRAHPELGDYAADSPITVSLAAAFPCPQTSN